MVGGMAKGVGIKRVGIKRVSTKGVSTKGVDIWMRVSTGNQVVGGSLKYPEKVSAGKLVYEFFRKWFASLEKKTQMLGGISGIEEGDFEFVMNCLPGQLCKRWQRSDPFRYPKGDDLGWMASNILFQRRFPNEG